jgi:capsular exopolysaccharide synthesis family protein
MNTSQQNGHDSNRGLPSAELQLGRINGSIEPHVGLTAQGSIFSTGSPAPNALALLKALRRRWPLALICGLVAASAAAVGTWCFLPPAQQMAYAKLYCPAKPEAILGQHPDGQPEFSTFLKTQVALIKDPTTLEAALHKPEIMKISPGLIRETSYPEEWLAQRIKVDFPDSQEIMRVSLERPTEIEAKLLVRAITESYLEAFADRTMSQRRNHLKDLKNVLKAKETELAERDKRINELGKKFGVLDTVGAATLQGLRDQHAFQIRSDILAKNNELFNVKLEYKFLLNEQQMAKPRVEKDIIEDEVEKDPFVIAQTLAIQKDEAEMEVLKEGATRADDPAIGKLRDKIDSAKAKLQSLKNDMSARAEQRLLRGQRRKSQESVDKLQNRIDQLQSALQFLNSELEKTTGKAVELTDGGFDLEREKDSRKRVAATVEKVNDEIYKLTVELEAPLRVMMLQPATIVHVEDSPRRLRFTGMAAFGAFLAALFAVAFLEFRSYRIGSVDEVVTGLGMTVMGALPAYRSRGRLGFARTNGPGASFQQELLMDSIDSVRTMLIHSAESGSLHVVMITSAVSGEGKTSLATHLGGSLARAGYKTLLVDADLRRPALDRLFDLPSGPGLSELLRGEIGITTAVLASRVPDLWVMPAGRWNVLSSRALARGHLQPILDQLRGQYECVIVDSSPLLLTADALSIAKNVDGVLFAIMHDVSRLPRVHAAYQRLEALGVRILGAVVNGAVVDRAHYGYRYVTTTVESSSSPPASS